MLKLCNKYNELNRLSNTHRLLLVLGLHLAQIFSQRFNLQIPSHWRVGAQHLIFRDHNLADSSLYDLGLIARISGIDHGEEVS